MKFESEESSVFDRALGQAIIARRTALGMRQIELSQALRANGVNWSQGTLSKVELGTRPVRFSEVGVLAATLETTPDQLGDPDAIEQQSKLASHVLDAAIRALQELKEATLQPGASNPH